MAKKRAKAKPKTRSTSRSKGRSKLLPVLLVLSLAVNALLGYAYLQGKFSLDLFQIKRAQKSYYLKNQAVEADRTIGGIGQLTGPYQMAATNISNQLQQLLGELSISSDSPFFVEKVVMGSDALLIVTATEGHFNEHLYLAAVLEGDQIRTSLVFEPPR